MIAVVLNRLRLFGAREFAAHWRASVASVGVVAVSSALLLAVAGVSGSITESVDRMSLAIAGNVELEVAGVTGGGFDQSLLGEVAKVPGVAEAVPLMQTQLRAGDRRMTVIGVDASVTALDSDLRNAIRNPSALLGTPNGVVAGAGTGLSPGRSLAIGTSTVTVTEVVDAAGGRRINGGDFVVAPLGLAQRLADRPGQLDTVLVTAEPGTDRAALRAAVDTAVDGRAIVADGNYRTAQAQDAVAILRYATLIAASLAVVVAGFLMFNAMNMAVVRRRPALSTQRALGGSRSAIVGDLLLEAGILGLIGALIGIPIGIAMGRWAIGLLPALLFDSFAAKPQYFLPGYAIPVSVVCCVLASLVASGAAVRQVYRVAPIEALRPVGTTPADTIGLVSRSMFGAVGVAAFVGSVVVALEVPGQFAMAAAPLVVVGAVALSLAFVGPIARSVSWVAGLFGAAGRLGATSVQRAPRRAWATVMTACIVVAMVVAVFGASSNLVDSARASFSSLAKTDLNVSTSSPNVIPAGPALPADLAATLSKVPGVAKIVPAQYNYATVGERRILLSGVAEGTNGILFSAAESRVRSQLLAGEGVVLSRDVASDLDLSVGSMFEIRTPHGVQRLPVLEVVDWFSVISGGAAISLAAMQSWFDLPHPNNLELTVAPGADVAAVADAVRRVAGDSAQVFTGDEAVDGLSGAAQQATVLTAALTCIVALVGAIALLNTLMLAVIERKRELGLLRAMGASRRLTAKTVLSEAAAIGIVGGLSGLIVGGFAHYVSASALSSFATIDVRFAESPLVLVFALAALCLSLIGALPPASKAGRTNIIEAISIES